MQLAHRGQAPAKGRIIIGDANGFWQGYPAASQDKRRRRAAISRFGRRQFLKLTKWGRRQRPQS